MRDILTDLFENQPIDPRESARRGGRVALRQRFYRQAHLVEGHGASEGFAVALDGKPIKTPARRALAPPSRALAELIAEEWNAQEQTIDPASMPLTRLANVTIDAVADRVVPVFDEVVKYLGSDLLCYRADAPEGLVARQAQAWDPVLAWAGAALGARFVLIEGVVYAEQPREAIAAARAALPAEPWALAAVASITALTGSGLLALAVAHGRLDADAAWAAAHVDEDWQMDYWGRDELALARRAGRYAELQAAAAVLRHRAA